MSKMSTSSTLLLNSNVPVASSNIVNPAKRPAAARSFGTDLSNTLVQPPEKKMALKQTTISAAPTNITLPVTKVLDDKPIAARTRRQTALLAASSMPSLESSAIDIEIDQPVAKRREEDREIRRDGERKSSSSSSAIAAMAAASLSAPAPVAAPAPSSAPVPPATIEARLAEMQITEDARNHTGDYSIEAMDWWFNREIVYRPNCEYMKFQTDINDQMRGKLVDWLTEVHLKFKLLPDTLFLCVNLLDRFLEKQRITKNKLQLVGSTCLWIAAKYEEIYPPEIMDFINITDSAITREQMTQMEGIILNCLNFNVTVPSAWRFFHQWTKVLNADELTVNLARYLMELPLTEYRMLKYSPSNVAASALYLSMKIVKKAQLASAAGGVPPTSSTQVWHPSIVKHTRYNEQAVRPCAKDLCLLLENAPRSSFQAVRNKFSLAKFGEVAKIPLEFH